MTRAVATILVLAAALLAACGQKGALVRPDRSSATVIAQPAAPKTATP